MTPPADRNAFPRAAGLGEYDAAREAVLYDAGRLILESPERFAGVVLTAAAQTPSLAAGRNGYYHMVAAGYPAMAVFEAMRLSYAKHKDAGKVVYRARNGSEAGKGYSHRIAPELQDMPLEYYGLPGADLYVFRLLDKKVGDPAAYGLLGHGDTYRFGYSYAAGGGVTLVYLVASDKAWDLSLLSAVSAAIEFKDHRLRIKARALSPKS
ncbi:MAG: hypothetical protein HYZ74_03265 [Elusimicrobia bacterium]|nr:hypothetical protein [Elusimicrobiota bacterium]